MAESNGKDNGTMWPRSMTENDAQNALVRNMERLESLINNDELTQNAFLGRIAWWAGALDPQRNINKECGYHEGSIPILSYRQMYDRDCISARVVEVLPMESWQVQPSVYEDEDSETNTPFEEAWKRIHKDLNGARSGMAGKGSWYQDEEGSLIWSYMLRLDVQSGIGHYGVMLLGIDDGRDLSEPVEGFEDADSWSLFGTQKTAEGTMGQYGHNPFYPYVQGYDDETQKQLGAAYKAKIERYKSLSPTMSPEGSGVEGNTSKSGEEEATSNERKLIYIKVFDEYLAQITQYERDPNNPRFGLPVTYLLTFNDPNQDPSSAAGLPVASAHVHWSRVIHFADKLGSNEVLAYPRMKQCFNRLIDLIKTYGASGEGFWQMAFNILSGETNPQLGGDVKIDTRAINEQMQNLRTKLKRHLVSAGMTWKTLAPVVSDPTPFKDAFIEAICILIGCPKRVFMGSERGELASSQDDSAWNDRLRHRQSFLLTPRLVVPFIDRLIQMKVLPEPEGYSVVWPDLESLSDTDKATIASTKTTALSTYVSGNVEAVMTPMDFLTRIMGFDHEEAEEIVKAASQAQDSEEALTPGMQPPEETPVSPITMGPGQSLVHPETGETLAQTPHAPKG